MEVHIGAMRNNNTLMFNKIGADTGFDSVGDDNIAKPLSRFLDALNINNKLPKTILFNLNDKDNIVLAAMLGNFQSSDAESKIQFGPAWWFLDTMDGMTAQMKSLATSEFWASLSEWKRTAVRLPLRQARIFQKNYV